MQFVNQNSVVLGAAAILVAVALYLFRGGPQSRSFVVLGLVAVVLIGGWFVLRPTGTPGAETGAVRSQIGQGFPVLIEFQSPY